jgi:ribonuclease HI
MVIIYTDSQFYISTITNWMHKWFKIDPEFKTKLDGKPIANKDIICQLYFLWTLLSFYTKVEFKHVRSHQVAPLYGTKEYCIWLNNDIVDKMAKVGASETSIHIKYE